MGRRWPSLVAFASLYLMCGSSPAFAWGDEGHKAIAIIAYSLLSPDARKSADALLAADPLPIKCGGRSFVDGAVWPDKLREKAGECAGGAEWGKTASWHFVDVPLAAPSYARERDCPRADCVVAKIGYFAKVLADKSRPPAVRGDALRFVEHFVGDLHQPLHTTSAPFNRTIAQRDAQMGARRNPCLRENLSMDRGGNCVDVMVGQTKTELHAFWDTDIVKAIARDPQDVAAAVMRGVTPAQIEDMQRGSVVDWANESHHVAIDVVYRDLPPGPMPQLKGGYEKQALGPAELQIRRAGVRLAKVVEEALGR